MKQIKDFCFWSAIKVAVVAAVFLAIAAIFAHFGWEVAKNIAVSLCMVAMAIATGFATPLLWK